MVGGSLLAREEKHLVAPKSLFGAEMSFHTLQHRLLFDKGREFDIIVRRMPLRGTPSLRAEHERTEGVIQRWDRVAVTYIYITSVTTTFADKTREIWWLFLER